MNMRCFNLSVTNYEAFSADELCSAYVQCLQTETVVPLQIANCDEGNTLYAECFASVLDSNNGAGLIPACATYRQCIIGLEAAQNPVPAPTAPAGDTGTTGGIESVCDQRFPNDAARCQDLLASGSGDINNDAICTQYMSCTFDAIADAENDSRNVLVYTFTDDACSAAANEAIVPLEVCHPEGSFSDLFPRELNPDGALYYKMHYDYATSQMTTQVYTDENCTLASQIPNMGLTFTDESCRGQAYGGGGDEVNVYFRILFDGLKDCGSFDDCAGCIGAPQCGYSISTAQCSQQRCSGDDCVAGSFPSQNTQNNTCPGPENRMWRSWCDSKPEFGPLTLYRCNGMDEQTRQNDQTCQHYLQCLDSIADELTIFNDAVFTAYSGSGCTDAERVVSVRQDAFLEFRSCTPMMTSEYTRNCQQQTDSEGRLHMVCGQEQLDSSQFVPQDQNPIYVRQECVADGTQLALSAFRTSDCSDAAFISATVEQNQCAQVTYANPPPSAANIYFKATWAGSCQPCEMLADCDSCAGAPHCGWSFENFMCIPRETCSQAGADACAIGDAVQCPEPSAMQNFCPQFTQNQYRTCVLENESSQMGSDQVCADIKECQLGYEDSMSILTGGVFSLSAQSDCSTASVLFEATGQTEMDTSLVHVWDLSDADRSRACNRVYEAPSIDLRTDRDTTSIRYVSSHCEGRNLVLTGYLDPNCQNQSYATVTLTQGQCQQIDFSGGSFRNSSNRPRSVYVNPSWTACNGDEGQTTPSILNIVQVQALEILNYDVSDVERNYDMVKAALFNTIGVPERQITDLQPVAHVHPECPAEGDCDLKAVFLRFNIVGLNRLQEDRFNDKIQNPSFKDNLQRNLSANSWASGEDDPVVGDEVDIEENPDATPAPGGGGVDMTSTCNARFPDIAERCSNPDYINGADCTDYVSCQLEYVTEQENNPANMRVYTWLTAGCQGSPDLEDIVPLQTCHAEFNNHGLFPGGEGQVTFKGAYNYSTGGISIAAYQNDANHECAEGNAFKTLTVTNQSCNGPVTVGDQSVYYTIEHPGLRACTAFDTCSSCIQSPKCKYNLESEQCESFDAPCPLQREFCVSPARPDQEANGMCPAPEMNSWKKLCDERVSDDGSRAFSRGIYARCMTASAPETPTQECEEYVECLDSIADQLTLFNDAIYAAYSDPECSAENKVLEVVDREVNPFRECTSEITFDTTRTCDYSGDDTHMSCATERVDQSAFITRGSGNEIYVKTSCNWETGELLLQGYNMPNCPADSKFMEATAVEDLEGTPEVHQASCRPVTYDGSPVTGANVANPARIYFTSRWENECRPCRALHGCGQCLMNPTCSFDTVRHRCIMTRQDTDGVYPTGQEGGNSGACPEPALATNFCTEFNRGGAELATCVQQLAGLAPGASLSQDCQDYKNCYLGVEDELSILIAGAFQIYNQPMCNNHDGMARGEESIGGQDPSNPAVLAPHFPIAIGESGVSMISTKMAGLNQCMPVFESPLKLLRTPTDMMYERYVMATCDGRDLVLKGFEDSACQREDSIYAQTRVKPALCLGSDGADDQNCDLGWFSRELCEGLVGANEQACVYTPSCTRVDMANETADRHAGTVYVQTLWSACNGVPENDRVTVLDIVKIRDLVIENFDISNFQEYEPRFKQAFVAAMGVPPNQLLDATATDYVVQGCYNEEGAVDRTMDTCEFAFQLNFNIVGLDFNQEEELNAWIGNSHFRDRLQQEFNHAFYGTGMEPRVGNYINIEENPAATPTPPPGSPTVAPTAAPTAANAGFDATQWVQQLGERAGDYGLAYADRACEGGRTSAAVCLDGEGTPIAPWSNTDIARACPRQNGAAQMRCPQQGSATASAPFGKNAAGDVLAADGFRARDSRGVPYSFHDGIYQPLDKHLVQAQPVTPQEQATRPGQEQNNNNPNGGGDDVIEPETAGAFDPIWVIVPVICVLLIAVVGYYIYRQRKQTKKDGAGYGSSHFTHLLNEGPDAEDRAL